MMQHGIWQGLAICETVAKPVARSITSFFSFSLKKALKIFGKSFWAIQGFHHL